MESSKHLDRLEVHRDQMARVSDAILHEGHREVYRRRLIAGRAAATVRESVRNAVSNGLKSPDLTHNEVAELAALAADNALVAVGIQVESICDRALFRGRLSQIELWLALHATALQDPGQEGFDFGGASGGANAALAEVRSLIDSIHEE